MSKRVKAFADNECIVCNMEKPEDESTLRCKLCGMSVERKPIIYNRFGFCCWKCRVRFKKIWDAAGIEERERLGGASSLI
jgi:hypothetical protein